MRKLPPLNSLKAFEAAALHLSFSKAAEVLGVTQGAVSKQIKLLEEFLGFAVFNRLHQSLSLTVQGKEYLKQISKAFEVIEAATNSIRKKDSKQEILRINILPSLSSRWLVPLLDEYYKKYPHMQIQMDIGDGEVNLTKLGADVAIRSARKASWGKYHSKKIMDEKLVAVYSAKLKNENPVKNVNDLSKHKLLRHTTRPEMWDEYLKGMKIDKPLKFGSGFEHFFMMIEAVKDNMGIALVPEFLIRKELKEKSLFVALDNEFVSPFGYYFICSKPRLAERKIASFQNWLISR